MRKAYSILSVAIAASACGGSAVDSSLGPSKPELAQELATGDTPQPDSGPTSTPSTAPSPGSPPPAPPTPSSPTPASTTCDRDALNKELSTSYVLEGAITARDQFRCLCDDQGYPLVGNINAKGTTASEFCAALKDRGLL